MIMPKIDSREIEDLISEIKAMVPFYTPEWQFSEENPDAAAVLALIFTRMFQGNIKRMNMVGEKNFTAFINMLGVKLLSPKSARTYITFELSQGMKAPVFIKTGTSVYGVNEKLDAKVPFETAKNMLVTPAKIAAVYNVSAKQDKICKVFDINKQLEEGNSIIPTNIAVYNYAGENLQEHVVYIGHDYIFNVKSETQITLELLSDYGFIKDDKNINLLEDLKYFQWSYFFNDSWMDFDEVNLLDNKIILLKNNEDKISKSLVNGIEGRWIRCKLKAKSEEIIKNIESLEFNDIKLKCKFLREEKALQGEEPYVEETEDNIKKLQQNYNEEALIQVEDKKNEEKLPGIIPDAILVSEILVNRDGFYAFNDIYMLHNAFYVGSEEVFCKKGAKIELNFSLKFIENKLFQEEQINWKLVMKEKDIKRREILKKYIASVIWEYWNGEIWSRLPIGKEYDNIFNSDKPSDINISFQCPDNMAELEFGNQSNYWIRARITQIDNLYTYDASYISPYIEKIYLNYAYEDKYLPVQSYITYNNAEYRNVVIDENKKESSIKSFFSIDTKFPSLYIGFDLPPVKGPINIFFSIENKNNMNRQISVMEWEYLSKNETGFKWKNLKIADETKYMTTNGIISFAGPEDFALSSRFGRELYWIRILNLDGNYENDDALYKALTIKEMYINTVEAIQQETILNEVLEKNESGEYKFYKTPIIKEEIWMDETESLSASEIKELSLKDSNSINIITDSDGNVLKCFVKWIGVEDFFNSSGYDRHYVIDRGFGTLKFGDGNHGKLPVEGKDVIKSNYRTGGGTTGNLPPYTITELRNPIPFINRAYNPKGADGGAEIEKVEEALNRGAEILKHRNRAVTSEDFESLAKEASRNVAKVKCLPNCNLEGKKEMGAISLVIVPQYRFRDNEALYFSEIKKQVEEYILKRCANIAAFSNNIFVIPPIYIEISVSVILIVKEIDDIFPAEENAILKLDKFLDTFNGNYDEKGWEIGQYVHESMFFQLLKAVPEVINIEKVAISFYKIQNGLKNEIRASDLREMPYGLVTNGNHIVSAKTS